MPGFDNKVHHRRTIRLKEYDYSQAGAYFVTTCTRERKCLFGRVEEDQVRLNNNGRMVESVWENLPRQYPDIQLDVFVIMPNHIHGIIVLVGAGVPACPIDGPAQRPAPTMSLPDIIHRFKSFTINQYMRAVSMTGQKNDTATFWQRNYYEHVIRSEHELSLVRDYVVNNPLKWSLIV